MTGILSQVHVGDVRMREWDETAIKNEPMLFNADGACAEIDGGPITRNFVASLLKCRRDLSLTDIVVDTRVHMLMPGWYPCIPGFHHDDVPRLRADGQPYYPEFEGAEPAGYYHSKHAMTIVGGTGSFTQFALGLADFNSVPIGKTAYAEWHLEVMAKLGRLGSGCFEAGTLRSYVVRPRDIVLFDARSWHQGMPATGFGWRFFARASWDTNRVKRCTNEIRRQVQVYLEKPMEGW